MLKYFLYPIFGLGVIGVYALGAAGGHDMTSSSVRRQGLPAGYAAGAYRAAPAQIWRTTFHGPALARVASSGGGGGGGGGFYGGLSGGK